ncbi:TPA: hypothetical protein QCX47_002747 [Bacillus mycoides]|nr:hypothetical protein [Bacillus mycoides]
MLNKLFGTKKTKTIEVATQELNKTSELVTTIESQQAELQERIAKIGNAMNIIEATLLIDPKDKNAIATKSKGEKQLEELSDELASSQEQLAIANEKRFEAQKELHKSTGEKAQQHGITESSKLTAVQFLTNTLENIDKNWIITEETQDVSQAYGFGSSSNLASNSPEFNFIVEQGEEGSLQVHQNGKAIAQEALQAMTDVLAKHGVKFSERGESALRSLDVTTKK